MAEPPVAFDHMGEEREKLRAVTIITNEVLPRIAATGHMIDRPGEFDAEGTRHGARVVADGLLDCKT